MIRYLCALCARRTGRTLRVLPIWQRGHCHYCCHEHVVVADAAHYGSPPLPVALAPRSQAAA